MYNVIKSVIMSQRFELTDVLRTDSTTWSPADYPAYWQLAE